MSDEEAIRQLHENWMGLELDGRRLECSKLCTDDIVFQPPIGTAITGISAVKRLFRGSNEVLESADTLELVIETGGDLAVKRARFRTRVKGIDRAIEGAHFWVLRRGWRGWQVAYVSWSFDHTL